jgi:hypothetical protein
MTSCVYTHALLIGRDDTQVQGAIGDTARWSVLLRSPAPGPDLPDAKITVLTGAAVTVGAVKDAVEALGRQVKAAREMEPNAVGLLLIAGPGWWSKDVDENGLVAEDGCAGGLVAEDGRVSYADLVQRLDAVFPELEQAREAARVKGTLTRELLPRPALLVVLDTAAAVLPDQEGWRGRCVDGPPAGRASKTGAQPRLGYHARQIGVQPRYGLGEQWVEGEWVGEITASFGPWFAENHASLDLFAQEIGPENDGLIIYRVERPDETVLGTAFFTGSTPTGPRAIGRQAERANWHVGPLPAEFTLRRIGDASTEPALRPITLDTKNTPFVTPNQGGAPRWTRVYTVTGANGATIGYMGLSGREGAPSGQWWALRPGMADSHGYLIERDLLRFSRLPDPPTVQDTWSLLQTL